MLDENGVDRRHERDVVERRAPLVAPDRHDLAVALFVRLGLVHHAIARA